MEGYVKNYNRNLKTFVIETPLRDYMALKEDLVEELRNGDKVTFTESKAYMNVRLEGDNGEIILSRELISIASSVRKLSNTLTLKH